MDEDPRKLGRRAVECNPAFAKERSRMNLAAPVAKARHAMNPHRCAGNCREAP
jgi:hypothetical protein